MSDYGKLAEIARQEFADIVVQAEIRPEKLRVHLVDGSYVDVWLSRRLPERFAYHWERRHIDGKVYRYDNRPHHELSHMKGYPRHFHDGRAVVEARFSEDTVQAFREFLALAREKLASTT